ncbi:AAA family ATPase [Motilimonas eburnea]|uniref:AAA family ATPase n=1 Tax=Motilimonas eburnea TaxID=1737488 RepID=UPI001E64BFC6|nr:MoxR family ATPase [Motilimonas eburnea]MCE2572152.1 MoxR family ATPase [Motilimonas eburnea]
MRNTVAPILSQLNQVVLGKEQQVELALVCILAGGHLLIEDLPGMGKTTLAQGLATTLGLSYHRVQFTSDMLPADILGVSIFDPQQQAFHFHKGPIFNQVLLADEINRASPKTQSALLEAMAEQQISIDSETYALPEPFFVIATQNPLDQAGTFPLPESQLDRFMMRIELGFPDPKAELAMLQGQQFSEVTKVIDVAQLLLMQQQVKAVSASESVLNYLLRLIGHSRYNATYPNPLSPRCSKTLLQAAKAKAWVAGRDYLLPDDVQAVFPAVADHRLGLLGGPQASGAALSETLLHAVDPLV